MAKLTVSEKYYIRQHQDLSYEQLSKKMKVDIDLVKPYLLYVKKNAAADARKEEKAEAKKPKTILDQFQINERYGTAVMTQTASEIGDASARQSRGTKNAGKEGAIHKIRPE